LRCRLRFSHGTIINKEDLAFFVVVIWGYTHLPLSYVKGNVERRKIRREEKEVANIDVLGKEDGSQLQRLQKMGG
jgi:hypothetical protein